MQIVGHSVLDRKTLGHTIHTDDAKLANDCFMKECICYSVAFNKLFAATLTLFATTLVTTP